MSLFFCDPARIQTWGLFIRSELLYSAELPDPLFIRLSEDYLFVVEAGVEPARANAHRILSPACLPIPPLDLIDPRLIFFSTSS